MTRRHSLLRFAALIAISSVVFASCTSTERRGTAATAGDGRVEVGYTAPAYAMNALNGDSVSLDGQCGMVVLLNVWTTWNYGAYKSKT
ncbi:hypothetical protein [Gemmatimonas sp.]|uniref:hypothetical protein n=1 Tax=Gemmatimonas sp. TaxID=1962908 RepID=UPI00286A7BE5|nr:hypothetical protein [Gemmatimonas sp.]